MWDLSLGESSSTPMTRIEASSLPVLWIGIKKADSKIRMSSLEEPSPIPSFHTDAKEMGEPRRG